MKKLFLILIAVLAFSGSVFAQRHTTPFVGIGIATNFRGAEEGRVGPTLTVGFRNYNRNFPLSVAVGAEAFGYYIPSKSTPSGGAFGIPEIGLSIGPNFFKVHPHTGFMLGYDSIINNFAWGGKDGIAFEFGRHVTIDFSAYLPRYRFHDALYSFNFIWRFY
jgi:hypothetical protein